MDKKAICILIILVVPTILVVDAVQTNEVGGSLGWSPGVNYAEWEARDHNPGDILVFKYDASKHNVLEVDQNSYLSCFVSPNAKPLTSGNDEVVLDRPGTRYWIDGAENGKYCKENNMKVRAMVPSDAFKTTMKAQVASATPKVHVVGDDKGWAVDVDYQAWAKGKEFDLGDKLVFKYPLGKHNVIFADEASLKECKVAPGSEVFGTGNDEITLGRAGKHGFICGVADQCEKGMKLSIEVVCPYAKPKKDSTLQGARKLVQEN